MSSSTYDYAIIGAGAAGLNLCLAMMKDTWFADKSILLLDKDSKDMNDKTWCFWEINEGHWDSIICASWETGQFITQGKDIELHLDPYRYKMLNSIDFYHFAKMQISHAANVKWIKDEVIEVQNGDAPEIVGTINKYTATHVFDSRIDPKFFTTGDKYLRLLQHFKGWLIETKEPVFKPDQFIMMDYRLKWENSTSFAYVLPISENKALVEYTLFTPELIPYSAYDELLKRYIKDIMGIQTYEIIKEEYGVIPMTNYPFHKAQTEHITKIGTAGSWVKPSSGYSFKNAERNSMLIIENLKKSKLPHRGIVSSKFRYYDTLLLDILTRRNEIGESIFAFMYQRNSIQSVFRFLDEETNIIEDLSIMSTFNPLPFMRAIFNQLRS